MSVCCMFEYFVCCMLYLLDENKRSIERSNSISKLRFISFNSGWYLIHRYLAAQTDGRDFKETDFSSADRVHTQVERNKFIIIISVCTFEEFDLGRRRDTQYGQSHR